MNSTVSTLVMLKVFSRDISWKFVAHFFLLCFCCFEFAFERFAWNASGVCIYFIYSAFGGLPFFKFKNFKFQLLLLKVEKVQFKKKHTSRVFSFCNPLWSKSSLTDSTGSECDKNWSFRISRFHFHLIFPENLLWGLSPTLF